jgi:hypothetical protein
MQISGIGSCTQLAVAWIQISFTTQMASAAQLENVGFQLLKQFVQLAQY